MRDCPAWFQDALTRLGGVNPYGDPIFKLVWSTEPRMIVGGKFQNGFVGYREMRAVAGKPAWCLMVWESRELHGSPLRWDYDYRDDETGLLDCGGYPKHGRYRLLRKFAHIEVVQQPYERQWMRNGTIYTEVLQRREICEYRMEPCGLILDLMLPMILYWRKLSAVQKRQAIRQEEALKNEQISKQAKDLREGVKLSRVMRGSKLVQDRAEKVEKGMAEAMRIASRMGLGIQVMS